MILHSALAALSGRDAVSPWQKLTPALREQITVATALTAVIGLLVLWALFFRKRRHRSHRGSPVLSRAAPGGNGQVRTRRKWRRRRGRERPLNPTLAESRGLPEMRPERGSEAR